MEIVEAMESGDYEQLVVAVDKNAGLKAFIAILTPHWAPRWAALASGPTLPKKRHSPMSYASLER